MQSVSMSGKVYEWYKRNEAEVMRQTEELMEFRQAVEYYGRQEMEKKIDRFVYCMIEPKRWQMLIMDEVNANKTLRNTTRALPC